MSWLEDNQVDHFCGLSGHRVFCKGRLELRCIIGSRRIDGDDKVLALLETNPPELTEFICQRHYKRYEGSRNVRRMLLRQKIEDFGYEWMEFVIDNLPWKMRLETDSLKSMLRKYD